MKHTTSLRLRRIGSLLLALLLTLSVSFAKATPARADNKQQELQQAKEEAQNKLDEINAGIKAAQANQAAAAELKQQYAQQETVIKSQITILYEQITAIKEQIFTPFYTTKPAGEGTGLGLSITRSIIEEKHKGTIQVDSEEGKFTRFTIRIPLTK